MHLDEPSGAHQHHGWFSHCNRVASTPVDLMVSAEVEWEVEEGALAPVQVQAPALAQVLEEEARAP